MLTNSPPPPALTMMHGISMEYGYKQTPTMSNSQQAANFLATAGDL